MDDRQQRRRYQVAALLCSPGAVVGSGICVAVLTPMVSLPLPALLWALCGLVGVVAWSWLSVRYLRHGAAVLSRPWGGRRVTWLWLGITLGVYAAIPVLAFALLFAADAVRERNVRDLVYALVMAVSGPSLLIPVWMLRRRERRVRRHRDRQGVDGVPSDPGPVHAIDDAGQVRGGVGDDGR